MKDFIAENIASDERIVIEGKKSLLPLLISFIMFIISCVLFAYPFISEDTIIESDYIGVYLLVIFFIFVRSILGCLKTTINNVSTYLVVSNKRVVGERGLFTTITLDSPINKINDVFIKRTFLGQLFNYGSIIISTSSNRFAFEYLKNVDELKNSIILLNNDNKNSNDEEKDDPIEAIKKYKELLDMGAITEEEYNAKKKELL